MPVVDGIELPAPPKPVRAPTAARARPQRPSRPLPRPEPPAPGPIRVQPVEVRSPGGSAWVVWLMVLLLVGGLLSQSPESPGRVLRAMVDPVRQLMEGGPARNPSIHVVQRGESLSAIARQHGLTLQQLMATGENRRRFPRPDQIRPGERLEIPAQ
jgi:hypothetical protein